jgi:hypothetical protein
VNLNERLGYAPDARLLIINADDFGMCRSANAAVTQLLSEGVISSATIMMPCPWAKDAAAWSVRNPQADVGVHLTFTSEWENYKWGPVTRGKPVSSLVTKEGYFPQDCLTFERQAEAEQVREEIVAQIELARRMGLQPTHLDNHMGSLYGLQTGKHFLPTVLEICAQYGLPFRLPRRVPQDRDVPPEMAESARQLSALSDSMGVAIIDDLVSLPYGVREGETYADYKQAMIGLLRGLRPGLSELIIHPALVTDELKAIQPHWAKRGWDFDLFRDADIRKELVEEGIQVINWRQMQQLQRQTNSK